MEKILREILQKAGFRIQESGFSNIEIEIPREESFGDLSTPVAMNLAKTLKKSPQKIARDIVAAIESFESETKSSEIFKKIDVAGAGFINFTFTRTFLYKELKKLIEEKEEFLVENMGQGKMVQIEFVSANPTGPLHLGHGRGAAVGAALFNLLLEAGYKVERQYYINDAGRQVRLLGMSVFARYKQLSGVDYPTLEDGYRGDYVKDLAREFKESQESGLLPVKKSFSNGEESDEELLGTITDFAYKKMLAEIKKDLEDFGVPFDTWQSERELYQKSKVENSIDELRKKGYIYEKDGATWVKSTAFGDDKDRVAIKKDGEYTYFASDIAHHREKLKKGYNEIIDIWGADHHGYMPRVQAVIQALGYPKDNLKIFLVQMVTLLRGGKPVQMSKRAGKFITLREVMDEIGADTTKFLFLTRRSDSHLEVDIGVAKAQSSENPVYYVQYAHARINSILEKARSQKSEACPRMHLSGVRSQVPPSPPFSKGGNGGIADFNGELFNDEEMRIVKKLLIYPMVFKNAVLARETHRITFYLQDLAGMFHPYYHKYRIISDNMELTNARLALCMATQTVLKHGLKILGVKTPERM